MGVAAAAAAGVARTFGVPIVKAIALAVGVMARGDGARGEAATAGVTTFGVGTFGEAVLGVAAFGVAATAVAAGVRALNAPVPGVLARGVGTGAAGVATSLAFLADGPSNAPAAEALGVAAAAAAEAGVALWLTVTAIGRLRPLLRDEAIVNCV